MQATKAPVVPSGDSSEEATPASLYYDYLHAFQVRVVSCRALPRAAMPCLATSHEGSFLPQRINALASHNAMPVHPFLFWHDGMTDTPW